MGPPDRLSGRPEDDAPSDFKRTNDRSRNFLTSGCPCVPVLFMKSTRSQSHPSAPGADRARRRLLILQELADLGMKLARALAAEAVEPATDAATAADLTLAFCRVA